MITYKRIDELQDEKIRRCIEKSSILMESMKISEESYVISYYNKNSFHNIYLYGLLVYSLDAIYYCGECNRTGHKIQYNNGYEHIERCIQAFKDYYYFYKSR